MGIQFKPNDGGITIAFDHAPIIYVAPGALYDMAYLTDNVSTEVGWMGLAFRHADYPYTFVVSEVFVPSQEVHGTETEIDEDGMHALAEELLERDDGEESYNALRFWGHSHVNMGVSPSGTDEKTFAQRQDGNDFYIRLICNKNGVMKWDVALPKLGMTFSNVPWAIGTPDMAERSERLKREIAANVRTKTFQTVYHPSYKPTGYWDKEAGKWVPYASESAKKNGSTDAVKDATERWRANEEKRREQEMADFVEGWGDDELAAEIAAREELRDYIREHGLDAVEEELYADYTDSPLTIIPA